MALIAINIIALLITAVAITLLLTNNRSESASATTAGQTSTNATTTAPATTAQAPATTAAPTPAPATPAPATPAPTAAPRPPPTPAPTTQRPAPDPLLPSTDEVHHLAKDTIEGFLQADNDNQVDVAIGYLLPPVDEWVDEGSLSESGLRDNIGGDKSSDVWLTLASDITVLSGPAAGGRGMDRDGRLQPWSDRQLRVEGWRDEVRRQCRGIRGQDRGLRGWRPHQEPQEDQGGLRLLQ